MPISGIGLTPEAAVILVEWKGDDERPYRLSFNPHLTLVHVPDAAREKLVKEIAAAFESQLSKLADPSDTKALNVLDRDDLEWLLAEPEAAEEPLYLNDLFAKESPTYAEVLTAAESIESNEYRDEDPQYDQVEEADFYVMSADAPEAFESDEELDEAGQLAALEHRRLIAQDELAAAEARRDQIVAEVQNAAFGVENETVSSSRNQIERLKKILVWRIENLEAAATRRLPDLSEVRDLLDRAQNDELWPLIASWERRFKEVEAFIVERHDAVDRVRPPEWLIEQSQRELALAEQALETFASHEGAHVASFLEKEAQRRHAEALEVWKELEPYLEMGTDVGSGIDALIEELELFSGHRASGPREALQIITACLNDMYRALGGAEELRDALEREGRYLPSSANVFVEARSWLTNREADWAERRKQEQQLAEFQSDLEGLDKMLAELAVEEVPTAETNWQIGEAEAAFARAQQAYENEIAAIESAASELGDVVGVADVRQELEPSATSSDPIDRLRLAVLALREALDESVPLIINAAFDDLPEAQRDELLNALVNLVPGQQIIYFTQNEAVVAWAEAQDREGVSLCTVAA